ncbi:DUF397 domain-containing protein [Actinomadura geliboluensis]|uniref:DUF397 domain-containing protein n=1 Tax=Actinomadura geliboluensis TaxID=882440 RepID=UPI003696C256
MIEPRWRKSSHSDAHGQCVEVAAGAGGVAVRDSTDPAGPVLRVPAAVWRPLLDRLKTNV